MNITFLIGNGFDRALGLDTSYSAFYKWYVKRENGEIPEHIKSFRKEIDNYIKKDPLAKPYWSDAEVGFGAYTENFSLDNVSDFFDCHKDFIDNLSEYLKEQEELIDSEKIELAQKSFAAQIVAVLEQVDAAEYDAVTKPRLQSNDASHTVNFISFNYTRTLDRVFECLKKVEGNTIGKWKNERGASVNIKIGELLHAHGYIDRWPIFGVCSESSIANKELLSNEDFKTVMLKSESIKGTGELWRLNVERLINRSKYIVIFGMSLGSTDADYWSMISDWLTRDSSHQLVVFWRTSSLKNLHMSVLEKVREKKGVQDVFLGNSSLTPETFERIKDRIHVIINKNTLFALTDGFTVTKDEALTIEEIDALLREI